MVVASRYLLTTFTYMYIVLPVVHELKAYGHSWYVWSTNTICDVSRWCQTFLGTLKRVCHRFEGLLCFSIAQMPSSWGLAVLCWQLTDRQQTDKTNYFTTCGVNISITTIHHTYCTCTCAPKASAFSYLGHSEVFIILCICTRDKMLSL